MAGFVQRPMPQVESLDPDLAQYGVWTDCFGIDSPYDYDPVWEACRRLRISPSFHSGALGWVAMISIGAIYHLIPILFGKERMYSTNLINTHFWMSTIGTVLYITSMWVNGILQGLMWRAYNQDGTLTYSFVESVTASYPGYVVRVIGGAIFFSGMLIMAYNVYMTSRKDIAPQAAPAVASAA